MKIPSIKLMIPDRAIACIIFGCFSLFIFRVYASLIWLPVEAGHISDQAAHAMGPIAGSLETARRVLAIAALLWCIWSWCKEWWLPALIATLFTTLVLFEAFLVDT
jgi:hypothetical protein